MIIGLLGVSGSGKDTSGAVLAKELNGTCIAFADPMKRFCMKALGLTERQLWGDQKEKPILKKQLKALRIVPRGPSRLPGQIYFPDPTWRKRWMIALAEACGEKAYEEPISGFPGHMIKHGPSYVNQHHEEEVLCWWGRIRNEKGLTPRRVLQTFGTEFARVILGEDFWIREGLSAARKVLNGYAYDRLQGLAKRHGGSDVVVLTDVRFRNEVLALKRAGGKVFRITRPSPSKTAKGNHASESEQSSIPNWWLDGVLNNDGTKVQFENQVRALTDELKSYEESWTLSLHPQLRDE